MEKNNNEKYKEFGDEWVKEMMKFTKKQLIDLLKEEFKKNTD